MKTIVITLILFTSILTIVPTTRGQKHSQNSLNNLSDKFEKAIKVKEPKFKFVRTQFVEQRPNYVRLIWMLDKEYVFANVADYYDLKEAVTEMSNYVTMPRPLSAKKTKLTDLGDEAYMELSRDRASIVLRKGKIVINVAAINPEVTKRFAKHFMEEIEKPD